MYDFARSKSRTFLNGDLVSKINSFINGSQKVLNMYDKVRPVIQNTIPMINNLKTTFKVAAAVKRFGGLSSIVNEYDKLDDYISEDDESSLTETQYSIENPFYPWYTYIGDLYEC